MGIGTADEYRPPGGPFSTGRPLADAALQLRVPLVLCLLPQLGHAVLVGFLQLVLVVPGSQGKGIEGRFRALGSRAPVPELVACQARLGQVGFAPPGGWDLGNAKRVSGKGQCIRGQHSQDIGQGVLLAEQALGRIIGVAFAVLQDAFYGPPGNIG